MSEFFVKEISGKKDLKDFILFPARLHKHHPNWVPPIYQEEWNYFNKKKNKAFEYCSTIILLAQQNGETVGRIMGIINHRYNDARKEKVARFSMFDCINNINVAQSLLAYIENWASEKGMNKIIGPMGMYYHDPIGYMIEGFKEKPSFAATYNFEYIITLMNASGYDRETDLVVYKIKIPDEFPELHRRIRNRVLRNNKLQLAEIRRKRDMQKYIFPLLRLMNETYQNILGYSQLDKTEMKELAGKFIPMLNPDFLIIATCEHEIAGFIVGIPGMNEGIIAARGDYFHLDF